jgi:hypothetical protein
MAAVPAFFEELDVARSAGGILEPCRLAADARHYLRLQFSLSPDDERRRVAVAYGYDGSSNIACVRYPYSSGKACSSTVIARWQVETTDSMTEAQIVSATSLSVLVPVGVTCNGGTN